MIEYVSCDEALKARIAGEWDQHDPKHWHLEDGKTIVALDGDAIVGFVSVYWRKMPAPLAECLEAFIDIIEVITTHRRQGIATKLLGFAAAEAEVNGCIQLSSWSSEDKIVAIQMWRSLGFGRVHHRFMSPETGEMVQGYRVAAPCALLLNSGGALQRTREDVTLREYTGEDITE